MMGGFIQQVHILSKSKWLIPMCTMSHWHAAARDQNKQYLKLLLKVVDTKRLTITIFESLHIQESAAQRIRVPFTSFQIQNGKYILIEVF